SERFISSRRERTSCSASLRMPLISSLTSPSASRVSFSASRSASRMTFWARDSALRALVWANAARIRKPSATPDTKTPITTNADSISVASRYEKGRTEAGQASVRPCVRKVRKLDQGAEDPSGPSRPPSRIASSRFVSVTVSGTSRTDRFPEKASQLHNLRPGGVIRKGLSRSATPRRDPRPPGPAVALRLLPAWPRTPRSLGGAGKRRGGEMRPQGATPADAPPSTGPARRHGRPRRTPRPGEPARSGDGTRPWLPARKPRPVAPRAAAPALAPRTPERSARRRATRPPAGGRAPRPPSRRPLLPSGDGD